MNIWSCIVKEVGKKCAVQMILTGLCLGLTLGITLVIVDYSLNCSQSDGPLKVTEYENEQESPKRVYYSGVVSKNKNQFAASKSTLEKERLKRPRYFSTELGLRRKLLVGIILSKQSQIENLVAINQTLSSTVDKFLFFVGGQPSSVLKEMKILGSSIVQLHQVALTETKKDDRTNNDYNLVALRGVIKYFGDKFFDKFDYFAIFLDNYYIHGRHLVESVSQFSPSQDILWGWPNGNSCALEPGFVISRKIIQKLSSKFDRCLLLYPTSKPNSTTFNVFKCFDTILHNMKCSCEKFTQGVLYSSVPVNASPERLKFAVTVGPINDVIEIYRVHGKMSLSLSTEIQQKIHYLRNKIKVQISRLHSKYQLATWPLGISRGTVPKTRFDVVKWVYFDTSHLHGTTEVVNTIGGIDREDLSQATNFTLTFLNNKYISTNNCKMYNFRHGYRRLNPSRGMEYVLDFGRTNTTRITRVKGVRPFCKTELLSMPYVSDVAENRRVSIIVPVTSNESLSQVHQFLDKYFDFSTDRKLNTLLIFCFIIRRNKDAQVSFKSKPLLTPDSLKPEQIQEIKSIISRYNSKMEKNMMTDRAKVGYIVVPSYYSINSYKCTNGYLTAIDAVIKRIVGTSSLIFAADINIKLKDEVFNRIRMNTIMNWQAFSPIPFLEYNPSVYQPLKMDIWKEEKDVETARRFPAPEVSKTSGYFDTNIYRYFSFFAADYIAARKLANSSLLANLERLEDFSVLQQLFVRVSSLHILRGPEPNLKVPFTFPSGCSRFEDCIKSGWGSRALLAKTIFASHKRRD